MVEQWLPVPGYEGAYQVSDAGQVRSLDRVIVTKTGTTQRCKGVLLKQTTAGRGYPVVGLHRNGRIKTRYVHALVLLAFVGPRPDGLQHTRHLNGDMRDNRLINLSYGTARENSADRHLHGTARTRLVVATHCKRGHEFSPDNTIRVPGGRQCRACRRMRDKAAKRRLRAAAAKLRISA